MHVILHRPKNKEFDVIDKKGGSKFEPPFFYGFYSLL